MSGLRQQDGPQIPPKIDQTLLSLCSNRDVGRVLGARIASVARSVFRAFAEDAPDRAEIEQALQKIQRCVEVMASEGAGPATVLAELGQLSAQLQEMLSEPAGVTIGQRPAAYGRPPNPPPAAAAPEQRPPPAPAREPAPQRGAPVPVQRPRRSDNVPRALLGQLAEMVEHRARLLGEPLASLGALAIVDGRIGDALASGGFIAGDIRPLARAALAEAENDHQATAAALVLLRCGDQDLVLADMAARPAAPHGDHAVGLALRYHDPALPTPPLEPWLAATSGAARAALMTALAGSGHITPDALIAMLDDADDTVARRASDLLAWTGRAGSDRVVLEARLRAGTPRPGYDSIVHAAVALGSTAALIETRRMFDAGEPVTAPAVDTLAIAGDAGDAGRLLDLAARDPQLAARALLAAGHLGSATSAAAIAASAATVDHAEAVKARAIETIRGQDATLAPAPAGRATSGRLLYGQPWTIASALERLSASDELLVSRVWYALEATVRTGVRAGVAFDPSARVDAQRDDAARIRQAIETARRPLPGGRWLYFGQPTE